ncbi:MAG TPA: protein kinase [Planctomycetota bacterium]|nr:protein kinase [Planctomycetota bacterium]
MNNPTRVQLGDFTVVKKIGEGGMGTVYLARQESLERMVALKLLPRQFSENPEFVERFRREARAAASLVHPNVVQIYHVGEQRGVHYFAMEYVEGQSLEGLLAEGRKFEVDEALDIIMHVARALDAAAEKGLVHRDIKPANIMIDRKEVVKVMDFGLAKPSGELNNITQPGLVIGTPSYMSPEQGEGSEVDCRSDIYSLGMVLYKLLTGAVPFTGDNPGTVIYKHLHEAPKPPSAVNPKVPTKVDGLVLKCIAKKPDERFATPAELLKAVARVKSGESQTDPTMLIGGAARAVGEPTMPLPAHVRGELTPPTLTPADLAGGRGGPASPAPGTGTSAYPPVAGGGRWLLVAVAAVVLLAVGLGFGAAFYLNKTPAAKPPADPSAGPGPVAVTPPGLPVVDDVKRPPEATPPGLPVVDDVKRPPEATPPGLPVVDDPKKPPHTTPVGPPAVEDPRKPHASLTLGLSALAPRVPKDAELSLALPAGGTRQLSAANLQDVPELPAGKYTLSIRRRGYEPLDLALQLSAEGVTPALAEAAVEMKPTKELEAPYRTAAELLGAASPGYDQASAAIAELQKVAALDPRFRDAEALQERARKIQAAEKERWDREFAGADEKFTGRQWAAAREGFARIPAWHSHYRDARELMVKADENDGRVRTSLALLRESQEQGRFREAAENLAVLSRLAAATPEIEALSARTAQARKAWDEAEVLFAEKKYPQAKARYDEVVKVCPKFRDAVERGAACDNLGAMADSAAKGLAEAEALLGARKYSACLAALAGIKSGLSAEDQDRVGKIRARAETGQEQERVERQLAVFDAAFAKGEVDGMVRLVDRSAKDGHELAIGFERDARELFGAGVTVESSRHEIGGFSVVERSGDGAPVRVQAEAVWKFAVRLGEAGKSISGSAPRVLELNMVRGAWLISRVTANGKVEMAAAGGRQPAAGMIAARVREVDGEAVVIDRGADHGVTDRMVFDIFSEARVVRLPLAGDTPVFIEELPVASVEVARADRESSRCAFLREVAPEARARVKKGMLAASSLVRRGLLTTPVVTGHSIAPKEASAAAGRQLTVSVEAPAIEGAFLTYQWSADGGLLSAARTSEPTVQWTAPPDARQCRITVTVLSSRGERSAPAVIEVAGTGPEARPPARYDLLGRIGAPDLLERVQDAAFDESGTACLLDAGLRRVVVLDRDFRVRSVSGRWPTEFSRIAAHAGVLYCLDTRNCTIKRFSLAAGDPFAKAEGADIGSRGEGNGRLRNPVDLAVSPAGEICVLDAPPGAAAIQVFAPDGSFVNSFGCGGGGPGALENPVSVEVDLAGTVHVLDAGTRRIVSFRGGRPAGRFTCSDKAGRPVDVAYDPGTDSLLVLDAGFKQVAVFSPAGERHADRSLGLTVPGPGELAAASRLAVSRSGDVLAVCNEGRNVDRFSVAGQFLGRLGGEPFGAAARLACTPSGELLALDGKARTVRRVDPRGWVLAEFGGGKAFDDPVDLACDAQGKIYVLDAGAYAILAFDAAGRPAGKLVRKGTPPDGITDAAALAALRGGFVAVACSWKENAMVRADVDAQKLSGLPMTASKPRFVAVDADENVYAGTASGQVERLSRDGAKAPWTAQFKGLVGLKACGSRVFALDSREKAALLCNPQTGEVLARTTQFPAECDGPRDLAASLYETVFVFDESTRSVLVFRAKR